MSPQGQPERWAASGLRGVLFDLDGTLVDSAAAVLRGWQTWAARAGAPTTELAEIVHGRSASATIQSLIPGLSPAEIQAHVREVLRVQEIDPDPARPVPGAARLVRALAGHPWGVVTGCSAAMSAARLAAGGLPSPPLLITDEDVRAGKPDPEGYLLALRLLGITADDGIAIEDAPAGVTAAKAAGLRTIAVTSTHPATALTAADAVVDGLSEIQVTFSGGLAAISANGGCRVCQLD
jgi:mannitol-1-/sugar-/sorbitol-6-phosphatase